MLIPAPLGDVVDRVTILRLKAERITDPASAGHVAAELEALQRAWRAEGLPPITSLPAHGELTRLNTELWEVEDALRTCEATGDFGPFFVGLARSVYRLNDARAAAKRAINLQLGSDLVEVKAHPAY